MYDISWFMRHSTENAYDRYIIPAKIIKIIPKSQSFDLNERVVLEVSLPDIKIHDRVFETMRCKELGNDVYRVILPYDERLVIRKKH